MSLNNTNEECVSIHAVETYPFCPSPPCHPLFSPLQDCFTVLEGDFSPNTEIQFNRYAQDNNDGVSTIQLCQTEFRNGCNDLAYVVRHPGYNPTTDANDVALIFLPVGRQITDIAPVRLNRDRGVPASGQNLEAFGWGDTCYVDTPGCLPNTPAAETPNEPQTGILATVTNQVCGEIYGGGITNDMLCARTEGVAVGTGDSGPCNSLSLAFFRSRKQMISRYLMLPYLFYSPPKLNLRWATYNC